LEKIVVQGEVGRVGAIQRSLSKAMNRPGQGDLGPAILKLVLRRAENRMDWRLVMEEMVDRCSRHQP